MASAPTAQLAILKHQNDFADSSLPVSLLQSGQFLFLAPDCQGGLILQKPHYADFVGPGGAIGSSFDTNCTAIYVIGVVNFRVPDTAEERQQAYQQRMAYSTQLMEIAAELTPLRRAFAMLKQLQQWVGVTETQKIPTDLIAHLAGVLPKTAAIARQQRPLEAVVHRQRVAIPA